MKRLRRATLAAVTTTLLAAAMLLTGCSNNAEKSTGQAQVRLVNASSGYAALDLVIGEQRTAASVATGTASGYADVDAGSPGMVLTNPGAASALSSATRSIDQDAHYTVVAYGAAGALKSVMLAEEAAGPGSGKARLNVYHLAPDAGALDVYVTGADDVLTDATALAPGVTGPDKVVSGDVTSGSYRLRVTGAGNPADLRLDVSGLTLGSGQVAALVLTSGTGGVLVQALLVPQQDSVKALSSAQARARLVASVSGNGVVSASVGGSALLINATSPAIGSYVVVGGSSTAQALTVSVNGTPLAVPAQTLAPGGDYTLMVWGDAAAPQWTLLTDDNRLPAVATNARLRLVHGVVGLADVLTLTADFSPVAANVAQGQASAYATVVASPTMRLQVSSPRSTTPLFDQTSTPISGNQLYTVFVLGEYPTPFTALRRER